MKERKELLDADAIARALRRIASEVVERNIDALTSGKLLLVGIRTAGVPLAERLAKLIEGLNVPRPPLGAIDITLYRDDVFEGLPKPEVGSTDIPGATVDGRTIILVDDVLFTGRTIRAALDALMDFGRPRRVELAVLVDRGHRELPIAADYTGLTVQTSHDERVKVTLSELGAKDRAVLGVKESA